MMTGLISALFLTMLGADAPPVAADPAILTVDRILGGEFQAESFGPARWLDDVSGYTTLEPSEGGKGRDIVRYNPATGARSVLVPATRLVREGSDQPLGIADYQWSEDGTKLLIFTNTRRVWRQNTRGDYWVLDLETSSLQKLGGDGPEATLQFAKFDPAGTRVGYVREKEIYVENLADGRITKLTDDSSPTRINGTFDWVYEEEFFDRDGFRWSPDGEAIAYWQIDTEGMDEYVLVNTTSSLYPELTSIAYPKVGQRNPSARVGVVAAKGGPTRWIDVPGDPRNNYIPRMVWAGEPGHLLLQHVNRLQNANDVMIADVATGETKTILEERDDAWVDVDDGEPTWLIGGEKFLWQSERDGWRHLYLVSRDGGEPRLITPGDYDVIRLVQVDEQGNRVYFLASPENPTQAFLYVAPLDGGSPARRVTPADQGGMHDYRVSQDGRWAFHTWSSFGVPPTIELVSLPEHSTVRTLVDNAALKSKLDELAGERGTFFRVPIGEGLGVELDAWSIRPPDFDPWRKYPLLMHVYGEPAGQTVLDRWGGTGYLWHRLLAQHGYVVASVDNRGTPAPRGRDWRKSVYRQIGILAPEDQAAAVRQILDDRPYLDPDRVGVWGWSGGGSMTLNALFRHPELYRTGIAVAFVSDQKLYDTIYQERYMGLPDDNAEGYKQGSPITHAGNLQGNLLLIHGTGDDNCHYQSCERLINRLVALDKPFSMMAYPNRSHSISEGDGTSQHLYGLMLRFWEANLPPGPRQ